MISKSEMSMIELTNVTKVYSHRKEKQTSIYDKLFRSKNLAKNFVALDNITFSVKIGEMVGIIGHNGSAKTTLLRIISGITEPTSGKIQIHEQVNLFFKDIEANNLYKDLIQFK